MGRKKRSLATVAVIAAGELPRQAPNRVALQLTAEAIRAKLPTAAMTPQQLLDAVKREQEYCLAEKDSAKRQARRQASRR